MPDENIFANKVKQLRTREGLSQQELGKLIGISKQTINDIEHGRSTTTLQKATLLADYFKVSLDYLVGRTNNPEVNK